MDMHEISAIRKTFYTMWYIKKKQDGRERFSLSLFWGDKAFTEYDHEKTLRCAEKLYHFGVMKLYASRVVLYFFGGLYFSFLPLLKFSMFKDKVLKQIKCV